VWCVGARGVRGAVRCGVSVRAVRAVRAVRCFVMLAARGARGACDAVFRDTPAEIHHLEHTHTHTTVLLHLEFTCNNHSEFIKYSVSTCVPH